MKLSIVAAALALSACKATAPSIGVIPTPVETVDRTAADEQVAVGIEQGYKAFRLALELGVDTGVIKGPRATLAAAADRRAYAAVLTARQAYKTANAAAFITAARSANATLAAAIATVKGN